MNKKLNYLKKFSVVVLLCVIAVGSYFIAGTYAKYTRELTGTDTATVAKFSVTASGLNKEQTANINLFSNLYEVDAISNEANVAEGKIAPGTGGKFATTLTNNSEVDVKAKLAITETNEKNIPVEYSFDRNTWATAENITKEITLDYTGKRDASTSEDITVYWRWAYDSDDTRDTKLGESTDSPSITVKISVVFTKAD